jgi:hypothetical protein
VATTTSPADTIALYQCCVAAGIQAYFSIKKYDRYEKYLFCAAFLLHPPDAPLLPDVTSVSAGETAARRA